MLRFEGMSDDKHLEALHGIWGEMKAVNGRIDKTNERLDKTNERLERVESGVAGLRVELGGRLEAVEHAVERVGRRQVEAEIRVATELAGVAGTVGEVRDLLRAHRDDRKRIDALEHRVDTLERKVR